MTRVGRRKISLVAFLTIAAVTVALPVATSAAAEITCNGLVATIVGNGASEVIDGTSGDDIIHGKGGADIINGKGGNDVICGGSGLDELWGNSGDDVLIGGKGADLLKGGAGNDKLLAGAGADVLFGGEGDDILSGGDGADLLEGGNGQDELRGKKGRDQLFGQGAADTADGGSGKDECDAESEVSCEWEPIDYTIERLYVSQAVPAVDSDEPASQRVGTVVGREGIIRIFAAANRTTSDHTPLVELHWRDGAGVKGKTTLTGPTAVPKNPAESSLGDTFDYVFDPSFVDEGMDIWVEVDPDDEIAEGDESNNRFPSSGWYDIDAEEVESFDITFVPMTVNGVTPSISQGSAEALLGETLALLPIADYSIEIHSGVSYTGSNWNELLNLITDTKIADGSPRLYLGIVDPGAISCCTGGIGWVGWPAAVSLPFETVIAHELGHTLSLNHAPCGGPSGVDPGYPYAGANIGTWGYSLESGSLMNPAGLLDVMSYCNPTWISDYNFGNAVEFRRSIFGFSQGQSSEGQVVLSFAGTIEGVDRVDNHERVEGEAIRSTDLLEPATATRVTELKRAEVIAAAPLPPRAGDYDLVGVDADGDVVTSVSFATYNVESASADAAGHFAFSVAVDVADAAAVVIWQVRNQGAVVATLLAG